MHCYKVTNGEIENISLEEAGRDDEDRGREWVVVASHRQLMEREILDAAERHDRGEEEEGNLPGQEAIECKATGIWVL